MESKRKVLQKLFLSTLYLSAFTFGGGYVIVTLMMTSSKDPAWNNIRPSIGA